MGALGVSLGSVGWVFGSFGFCYLEVEIGRGVVMAFNLFILEKKWF